MIDYTKMALLILRTLSLYGTLVGVAGLILIFIFGGSAGLGIVTCFSIMNLVVGAVLAIFSKQIARNIAKDL